DERSPLVANQRRGLTDRAGPGFLVARTTADKGRAQIPDLFGLRPIDVLGDDFFYRAQQRRGHQLAFRLRRVIVHECAPALAICNNNHTTLHTYACMHAVAFLRSPPCSLPLCPKMAAGAALL